MTRIPHLARNLRRLAPLFDGHAAGHWQLPDDLTAARGGILRLDDEQLVVVVPDAGRAEADHLEALVASAKTADKDLPDSRGLTTTDTEAAYATRRKRLLALAVELADSQLGTLATDNADSLITGPLSAAVAEVMTAVAKGSKQLPDDPTPERLLREPEAIRRAWFAVEDATARYDAIRRAAAGLRRNGEQPKWDTLGNFAELHNYHEVTKGLHLIVGGPRPWPDTTTGRLLWYARNNGKVWLPTLAQMDARYYEVHGDKIRQVIARGKGDAGLRAA
jgi:hypothetical protein